MLNISKEEFTSFINGNNQTIKAKDKYLIKTIQNDITYILYGDISENNLFSEYYSKMQCIGCILNGNFHYAYFEGSNYGESLKKTIDDFQEKFTAAYLTEVSRYTINNPCPITEKTQSEHDYNINDYKNNRALEQAKREFFNVADNPTFSINVKEVREIFFDCYKNPDNFSKHIQNKIEENATFINYQNECAAIRQGIIEDLKKTPDYINRLEMYNALKDLTAKTVKIDVKPYGQNFTLTIEKENLISSIIYHDGEIYLHFFTRSVEDNIKKKCSESTNIKFYDVKLYTKDISKITYGKKVIFEKN